MPFPLPNPSVKGSPVRKAAIVKYREVIVKYREVNSEVYEVDSSLIRIYRLFYCF